MDVLIPIIDAVPHRAICRSAPPCTRPESCVASSTEKCMIGKIVPLPSARARSYRNGWAAVVARASARAPVIGDGPHRTARHAGHGRRCCDTQGMPQNAERRRPCTAGEGVGSHSRQGTSHAPVRGQAGTGRAPRSIRQIRYTTCTGSAALHPRTYAWRGRGGGGQPVDKAEFCMKEA